MVKRRARINPLRENQINPQARVVDTFEAPTQPKFIFRDPRDNSLERLTRSLRGLSPKLNQFIFQTVAISNQDRSAQMKADFLAGQAQALSTPSTEGNPVYNPIMQTEEFRSQSPEFQRGYLDITADTEAKRQTNILMTKIRNTGALNNKDFGAAHDAVAEGAIAYRSTLESLNLSEEEINQKVVDKFLPIEQQLSKAHADTQIQIQRKNTEDTVKQNILNTFYLYFDPQVGVDGYDEMLQRTGSEIASVAQVAKEVLGDGRRVNDFLIEQIINIAEENNDPSLLDLAKHIPTKDGQPLDNISRWREARTKSENRIFSRESQRIELETKIRRREEKQLREALIPEAINQLRDDPFSDISPLLDQANRSSFPDISKEIITLQTTLRNSERRYPENQVKKSELVIESMTNEDMDLSKVTDALQARDISADTAGSVIRNNKSLKQSPASPEINQAVKDIGTALVSKYISPLTKFADPAKPRRIKALYSSSLAEAYAQFEEDKGRPPRGLERTQLARDVAKSIEETYPISSSIELKEDPQNTNQKSSQQSKDLRAQIQNDQSLSPEEKERLLKRLN